MSEEVRQFVEMVRTLPRTSGQATPDPTLTPTPLPPAKERDKFREREKRREGVYEMYCEGCGKVESHWMATRGREEVYACWVCGREKWFTVR